MNNRRILLVGASVMAVAQVATAQAQVTAVSAQSTSPAQPASQSATGAQDSEQALAQAQADAVEEGRDAGDIIVTGTQIRGATPTGSQLLTTTAEQAKEQGAVNGNEILSQIPQASNVFQSLPSLAGLQLGTTGLLAAARLPSQQVTLRQLPSGQVNGGLLPTLTLIDGHRAVPTGTDVAGGQQVDNSTISAATLLRAEVMPDGASSIYGSDALVGVINYITRDSFDGIELQARGGIAGKYRQYDASLMAGTKWSTGSIFGSFAYSYHSPLLGEHRDYLVSVDANPNSPLFNTALGLNCASPNIAITTAVAGVQSRRLYPLTGINGTIQPYTTNNGSSGNGSGGPGNVNGIAGGNRCDSTAANSFYPEEKRYNAAFGLRQELSDTLTFGLKAMWVRRESETSSTTNIQPTISSSNINYRPVCNTPGGPVCGVTPGFATGDDTQTQTIFTNLGATSIGPAFHSYVSLESWQVTPTLTWDVSKDWQVRALVSYGESKTTGIQGSLDSALLQGRVTSGLINPYNLPASGPGAFDGLVKYSARIGKFSLFNAKVIADGPVFSLPGGEVRVAVGGEYFKTKFSLLATGATQSITPSNFIFVNAVDGSANPVSYTQTVHAAFAEANIPLIDADMNVPLIHSLGLSASGRYDKYNDFGSTFNYMVGANWSPTSWIKVRGNYNTSFSAPSNITYLGTVVGAQANNSSCNAPAGAASCAASVSQPIPYFPGYYAPGAPNGGQPLPPGSPPGTPTGPTNQTQPTAIGLIMNNGTVPGIGPQRGKSWSVGFDVEPPFVPGLSFGLGYYNLKITDQIQGIFGTAFTNRTDAVYCHGGVRGNSPNAPALCAIPFSVAELTTPGPMGWLVPVTAGGQALPSSLTSTGPTTGSGTGLPWSTVLGNYCGPDVYPVCPANSYSVFTVSDLRVNNIATLYARGLDFRAAYQTAVPWGSVDLRLTGTVSLGVESRASPTAGLVDEQRYGTSTLRTSLTVGTTSGGFRGQVTWQHSGGYRVDPLLVGTVGTATVPGMASSPVPGAVSLYGDDTVGAYNTFDLFLRYDFDHLGTQNGLFRGLQLTLNVNNIFDTDPPRSGGGYANGSTLGRAFLLGLRKQF